MSDQLTWIGHSTVLLELDGIRVITDPLLRSRVAHLRRHSAPADDPGALDAVLLSHLHHDHLDLPSLRRLPGVPVVGPPGAARALRRERRPVHELAPGETFALRDVTVRAVPAVHAGKRLPLSGAAEAIGFVVEAEQTVYFAGDTALFDGMTDIAANLDVALVPIWGWGPRLGPGHMDPDEAAEAVMLLQPAIAVPIHWGTYLRLGLNRRHGYLLRDPARAFAERVRELAPHVQVEVLRPGERIALTPGPATA